MSYALTEDHVDLASVARDLLANRGARAAARELLDATHDSLPSYWTDIAELGWLGLHLPEEHGGQGFGLDELAVVLFEIGYANAAGPILPTVVVSGLIAAAGTPEQHRRWLPGLADGSTVGGFGFESVGSMTPVLGGELAGLVAIASGDDVVIGEVADPARQELPNLDPSRRVASVDAAALTGAETIAGGATALRRLASTLAAAEAAGGARACVDMAVEYAKERVQFGRTIGSFQAIKHHCADMLVMSEQAIATAWGAARGGLTDGERDHAAAVAATIALPAFADCAELNVQVHGGIGYTWEHDAHLFLRRAHAMSGVVGGGDPARELVTSQALDGAKVAMRVELPGEADGLRTEIREFVAGYRNLPPSAQRQALVDARLLVPHWPEPFGRAAGPLEQVVIDEEFAGVPRLDLGISGWNTLTILQNGTPEQIDRWILPSLEGELEFCQLYSEPNAGSDAAGVQTRGTRVDGGWTVTGQKVWTSGAMDANRGFATVRTNPDAPKHQGITMMVIDMEAAGVEIRPLKQISGESHFCEVFFDEVFVPDDDVVGPVDAGWSVARSNLGNERVSIRRQHPLRHARHRRARPPPPPR